MPHTQDPNKTACAHFRRGKLTVAFFLAWIYAPLAYGMIRGATPPPREAVTTALSAYRAHVKSAETVLKIATATIGSLGSDCAGAIKILKHLEKAGIRSDEILYSAVIGACAKEGRAEKAHNLLKQMTSKGLRPSAHAFTGVVQAYGVAGFPEEARAVFEEMLDTGILADTPAYNNLLNIFANLGRTEDVEKFRREMDQSGITTNSATKAILLKAYAIAGRTDKAEEIFRALENPTLPSYTTLMSAYARARRPQAAHALLKRMRQIRLFPNVIAYNTVIHAYALEGDTKRAFKVFREMKERTIAPNLMTYNALLEACANSGRSDQALSILRSIPMSPNVVSHTLVFAALVNAKEWEKALSHFESLLGTFFRREVSTSIALDLHCDQFYTLPVLEEEFQNGRMNRVHIAGVPKPIALVALLSRLRTATFETPFPAVIIVGTHGNNVLQDAVQMWLSEQGFKWKKTSSGGQFKNISPPPATPRSGL